MKNDPSSENEFNEKIEAAEKLIQELRWASDRIASRSYESVDDFLHESENRIGRESVELRRSIFRGFWTLLSALVLISILVFYLWSFFAQRDSSRLENQLKMSEQEVKNLGENLTGFRSEALENAAKQEIVIKDLKEKISLFETRLLELEKNRDQNWLSIWDKHEIQFMIVKEAENTRLLLARLNHDEWSETKRASIVKHITAQLHATDSLRKYTSQIEELNYEVFEEFNNALTKIRAGTRAVSDGLPIDDQFWQQFDQNTENLNEFPGIRSDKSLNKLKALLMSIEKTMSNQVLDK